jgi:phosphoglycerate dehydrogenase-like enzyme
MTTGAKPRIAILDDFQQVALAMADWSALAGKAEIEVFHDHLADSARVVERLAPFDIVCVMRERTPLTRAILGQLPKLKLICSTAPRNASIDLAAAAERGITVCGTGYTSHGAAEATWALILGLLRHIPAEANSLRAGGWQVAIGGDLEGRTIGLVGLGNLGARVAKVAKAFGMNAIAWSTNLTAEKAEAAGARPVDKDTLFRDADIVTIHLVLSPRSRGIIGAREIGLMKPTAYLINSSRGPLVDEAALIDALTRRRIAGAALDVFDTEPLPPAHPFRTLDTVLATPHIGFVTRETYTIFYRDTVENILAWLAGKPIRVTPPA